MQYDGFVKYMLQDYYDDRIHVKKLHEICFTAVDCDTRFMHTGCGNVATLGNSKASEASQSYAMQPAV